jgi:hypothetical protein
MIRRVIATQYQAATVGARQEVDTFFDRVVKYIPTEIVSAWVAAKGLVESTAVPSRRMVLWICFAVGVVLTGLYTLKQTAIPGQPPAVKQTAITTIAFAIWVMALGEPFATLLGKESQSLFGSLLLIGYTLVVSLFVTNPDPSAPSKAV